MKCLSPEHNRMKRLDVKKKVISCESLEIFNMVLLQILKIKPLQKNLIQIN